VNSIAIVECTVCGAARRLRRPGSVGAAEVAEFAASHGDHQSYGIQVRLGEDDHSADIVVPARAALDVSTA
jgi:hypothetical protein